MVENDKTKSDTDAHAAKGGHGEVAAIETVMCVYCTSRDRETHSSQYSESLADGWHFSRYEACFGLALPGTYTQSDSSLSCSLSLSLSLSLSSRPPSLCQILIPGEEIFFHSEEPFTQNWLEVLFCGCGNRVWKLGVTNKRIVAQKKESTCFGTCQLNAREVCIQNP